MYLGSKWYELTFGGETPRKSGGSPRREPSAEQSAWSIAGSGTIRARLSISSLPEASGGTAYLKQSVDAGEAAVAFSMYPVSVGELMAISDANEIMPPKSTWF